MGADESIPWENPLGKPPCPAAVQEPLSEAVPVTETLSPCHKPSL